MKQRIACLLLLSALLSLCGCGSLLEREYTQSEPHSEKYWDAGDSSVLRASNRQELVNDILTLLSGHVTESCIRLYTDTTQVEAEALTESAVREVQEETALGAYAVKYMSYTVGETETYYEVRLAVSYRRSAEQVAGIVSVSSAYAVEDLLRTAVDTEAAELTLRIGYFNLTEQEIEATLRTVENECGVAAGTWQVFFYPTEGSNRIIEFLFENQE